MGLLRIHRSDRAKRTRLALWLATLVIGQVLLTSAQQAVAQTGDDSRQVVEDPTPTSRTPESTTPTSPQETPTDSSGTGAKAGQTGGASDTATTASSKPTSTEVTADGGTVESQTTTVTSEPASNPAGRPVADPDGQSTTTTTDVADGEGDGSTSTTDPLINEAPRDTEQPDPNVTVPPPKYDQPAFQAAPVLWSSVNKAEDKLTGLRQERRELIATVRSLRKREKELELSRQALSETSGQAVLDYNQAAERLRQRAIVGYVELSSGNVSDLDLSLDLTSLSKAIDQQRKTRFLDSALAVDRDLMADFAELEAKLDADSIDLVDHGRAVASAVRSAERQTDELGVDVDQAIIEAEAFRAGSEIYIDGVVFPIAGNYSTPLIDSFGFPRMPGTPDAHWHEGIDLFAPRGTPLVAAERGVVVRIGNGRLGGLKFWLRGESGADWYYAHLDSFAPGLHNGQVVQTGELLGYVGNTGNAVGTPPHLHLEIHPGGGRPVNPYPLLRIVSDLELDALAAGTHPGFRYQPRIVSRSAPTSDGGGSSSTSEPDSTTSSKPDTTATRPTTGSTQPTSGPTTTTPEVDSGVGEGAEDATSSTTATTAVPTSAQSSSSETTTVDTTEVEGSGTQPESEDDQGQDDDQDPGGQTNSPARNKKESLSATGG